MFVLPANGSPTPTRPRTKAWSCTPLRDQCLPALCHQAQLHQGQRATDQGDGSMSTLSRWCSAGLDAHPEKMRQRRETVEHPFGTIKARSGATHFLMKTLPKVATEMALHVLAYNLTRVTNIMGVQPLMAAMRA